MVKFQSVELVKINIQETQSRLMLLHRHCSFRTNGVPSTQELLRTRALFDKGLMADSEYSSTNENSKDSQDEITQELRFQFSEDEEALVIRMFKLVGERWSLIGGRIPGRTANEIERYWKARQGTIESK